ncbi:MAG: HAD family hydrolase [Acidobacteriaceae bacterium]
MRAVSSLLAPTATCCAREGFDWRAAKCFLFDIDGTLLNTRDGVHYHAFSHAFREVWGIAETIDGVPWHGNTDVGIILAVAQRAGISGGDLQLEELCRAMAGELERTSANLKPEPCPAVPELLRSLEQQGKILGIATGNIECVAWAKLENSGLRKYFSFGACSGPAPGQETREAIFTEGVRLARAAAGHSASVHVVGDTPNDIQAARAVGIPVIGVATGKYGYEELRALGPDMVVSSFESLAGDGN